jgi:hypothetical protein
MAAQSRIGVPSRLCQHEFLIVPAQRINARWLDLVSIAHLPLSCPPLGGLARVIALPIASFPADVPPRPT